MHDEELSDAAGERIADAEEVSIADAPTPDAQAAFLAETDAHSRSTKRWWIIGAAFAVAVAIAAVTWALWPPAQPSASVQAPAETVTMSSASTTSSATARTKRKKQSSVASATAQSASGTVTGVRPAAPNTVASAGSKLTELQSPPERTIGMLVVPKGFTPASYNVAFQPYGWGPGGPGSGRLVVKVTSSKPTNESATKLDKDFAGRNVTLWAAPQASTVIKLGGTYRGVMQVRPQGDVGVLYLVSADSAN